MRRIRTITPLALALPSAVGSGSAVLLAGHNPALAAIAYTGAGIGTFILASALSGAGGEQDHG